MKRILLLLILAGGLVLSPPLAGRAEAGKGRSYSSGGSSFSRGSSSSFRTSGGGSSSFRPSGRSYSSGGSWGGKSSPAPSFSKPPAFRPSVTPRPSGGSFDSGAAAAQRRQESKQTFQARHAPQAPSGGISPQGRSYSAGPPAPSSMPSGRTYSLGKSGRPGSVKAPAGDSFDANAAAAQRREESRAAFTQGTQPRPTYTTSGGENRPIDPTDRRVEQVRRQTDPWHWTTREERRRQVFVSPPVPPAPVVVVYHDPYSNWFWWWLLTRDQSTRAAWAYNHQAEMDPARYRDLLAKDQQLEARIRELEAKKQPRDPTYVPPGIDSDLMYDDGFVDAAVNPQPAPPPPPTPARTLPGALWRILLVLLVMAFVVWLVFIKRWGGD
jgi:hypothetical protein